MRAYLLGALISALASGTSFAQMPSECIASTDRENPKACPHLKYTRIDFPSGKRIMCLCMTDLKPLRTAPTDAKERIQRRLAVNAIMSKYRLTEEEFEILLKP